MAGVARIRFKVFRYQLLPKSHEIQVDWVRKISSKEQLIKEKNKIFASVIDNVVNKLNDSKEYSCVQIFSDETRWIFRMGVKKSVELQDKQFHIQHAESWPDLVVYFDNAPDRQYIAISHNHKATSDGQTVANKISEIFTSLLSNYQLSIHVQMLFEKEEFWEIISRYPHKIQGLKFELISPNMANISGKLQLDLRSLRDGTNTEKTILDLHPPKDGVLELDKDNAFLDSVLEYSSQGGGDVTIKVKGLKKRLHTSQGPKEISIDELEIGNINENSESLLKILGDLLK